MSFQLTFLGYYSIKSPQLKKQTHSVKRKNWSHRERTAQADGPRWTAEANGFRWMAIADGPRRTGQPSASIGRPWRTAPAAGGRRTAAKADVCQTRPWTSGRVTTLAWTSLNLLNYRSLIICDLHENTIVEWSLSNVHNPLCQ
jgi:hypothetical protein